jgi:hypothetical protein
MWLLMHPRCRQATAFLTLNTQIKALEAQIAAHADGHIFTSLPRSGTVPAARLLAEIGDCRARFPDPQALICLAGAAPSTRQSGKHKAVTFRWAVSKQLRDAVCGSPDRQFPFAVHSDDRPPGPQSRRLACNQPARLPAPAVRLPGEHYALIARQPRTAPQRTRRPQATPVRRGLVTSDDAEAAEKQLSRRGTSISVPEATPPLRRAGVGGIGLRRLPGGRDSAWHHRLPLAVGLALWISPSDVSHAGIGDRDRGRP